MTVKKVRGKKKVVSSQSNWAPGEPFVGARLYRYKVDWTSGLETGDIYASNPADLFDTLKAYLGYEFPRHALSYVEIRSDRSDAPAPAPAKTSGKSGKGDVILVAPPAAPQAPAAPNQVALVVPAPQPPKRGYGTLVVIGLVGIAIGWGLSTAAAIVGAGALMVAAATYITTKKERLALETAREQRKASEVELADRILTEHIRGAIPDEVLAKAKVSEH